MIAQFIKLYKKKDRNGDSMQCNYDYVLFDLDGTLSASAEGIKRCIMLSLDEMGKPCPDLSDYSKFIGPPLIDTFRNLCKLGEDEAKEALKIYLRLYDTEGEPRNRLFDGIEELLEKLRDSDAGVAICSSKNQRSVERVSGFLDIVKYFDALCGSDGTPERKEKEDVIPYALGVLGSNSGDRVVLIGDTHFDAKGARLSGVDFIGVTYGYGTVETMRNEGAVTFCDSAKELDRLLFG